MRKVDVAVVGAGLAGLSAAWHLIRSGFRVTVLEQDDDVGGRVRTDVVSGFRLDRGFQILLSSYPEVRALFTVSRLGPCPLPRGVAVPGTDGTRCVLADPRERPDLVPSLASGTVVSWRDLIALGALSTRDLLAPSRTLLKSRERSTRAELTRWGLSAAAIERVVRPFLSGVFLENDLDTSSRFFHLVWRSFARGSPVVPAEGMGSLAHQLADHLPPDTVRCRAGVARIEQPGAVFESGETVSADAVVVATDGTMAARMLPGVCEPRWNSVTTFYHRTDSRFENGGVLTVDPQGPVLNAVVLSDVAEPYAPRGSSLVSTSVLGVPSDLTGTERTVRERLARLYDCGSTELELVASYPIERAVPAMPAGRGLRRPVRLAEGLYVCGDHRDTPSIQGALFSGRRAARAVLSERG